MFENLKCTKLNLTDIEPGLMIALLILLVQPSTCRLSRLIYPPGSLPGKIKHLPLWDEKVAFWRANGFKSYVDAKPIAMP
jgi:hypothetical protein